MAQVTVQERPDGKFDLIITDDSGVKTTEGTYMTRQEADARQREVNLAQQTQAKATRAKG